MHRLCDSTAAPPVQCIHTHNLILMSSRSKKLLANLPGTLALIIAFGSIAYAGSWTNPPANPPGNNVDTPINVGSALQFKSGPLVLSNSLSVGGLLLASNGITVGSANAPSTGGIRASGDICTSAGGGKCLSSAGISVRLSDSQFDNPPSANTSKWGAIMGDNNITTQVLGKYKVCFLTGFQFNDVPEYGGCKVYQDSNGNWILWANGYGTSWDRQVSCKAACIN